MVIVVRLASATRRPTVHWAHHDRGSAAWPGRALQRDSSGWVPDNFTGADRVRAGSWPRL